eukprot:Transcript_30186.p1 GENE.Transcript_30186~~Transcript_30186.p1  ORF type:complete len:521 (-),score=278.19 Transcript_30186:153-1661(-)
MQVIVKWGKQQFEVELDTSESVETFKAQLFALTSVPIERQKIMGVKGGTMKDDANLAALGIKPGQKLMLMGSAEVLAAAPEKATVFAEDLPQEELDAAEATNPAGLANLGNTCYLNSSLQCMRAVPEISTALQKFVGGSDGPYGEANGFISAMQQLNSELDRSNSAKEVKPFKFVSLFRTAYPMFAQQNEQGGGFMQQDAEECWSTLISALAGRLQLPSGADPSDLPSAPGPLLPRMEALRHNLGDMLFGIEMECSYKCIETEAEPAYTVREHMRNLKCNINDKTAHLYNAIETALEDHVEKTSETLGRQAQYEVKRKIARLPPYLAVQFVRFDYRKDTGKRAKILRTVTFPDVLDIRNLCTDQLRAGIGAYCSTLETEIGVVAPSSSAAAAPAAAGSSATPMEVEEPKPAEPVDMAVVEGAGCDNKTARYELFAIITHQGRTAEGGHYVAWVKKDKTKWLVFDDETVAEFPADRIKELHGGGDFHMAYMCFYRKMDGLTLD